MGPMLMQKMPEHHNVLFFFNHFHCLNRFFARITSLCIEFGDEAHIGAIDARTASTQKRSLVKAILRQQSWIGHRQKRLLTSIQLL